MAKDKWTTDQIRKLIDERDEAVLRGLVRLYLLQTRDERSSRCTSHKNGWGFNAYDADTLTGLAKVHLRGCQLTSKQMNAARRGVRKYAGQLTKIANGEGPLSEKEHNGRG